MGWMILMGRGVPPMVLPWDIAENPEAKRADRSQ